MKRLLLVLTMLIALSMFVAPVAVANPPVHQASGGGKLFIGDVLPGYEDEAYGFTARIDAEGNAKGQFQAAWPSDETTFHASIDCLYVEGNTAWIGAVVTSVTGSSWSIGDEFVLSVIDNGEGNDSAYDQISFALAVPSESCTSPPNVPGYFDLVSGNIQVQ